ncbi:MAG: leucyl aminopeptidase [Candidatus Puniceispirillaceae bacterium]
MSVTAAQATLSLQFSAQDRSDVSVIVMDGSQKALSGSAEQKKEAEAVAGRANFTASSHQTLLHNGETGTLLLFGIDDALQSDLNAEKAGASLYNALRSHKKQSAELIEAELAVDVLASLCCGALSQSYEFGHYFTKKEPTSQISLAVVADGIADACADGLAMLQGVFLARDLITEPANILYPAEFASRCQSLTSLGLSVDVLDEAQMEKLGMGALLGVGQGSRRESKMVVMQWHGGGDEAPLAYVGKGVCFDTGGISLKPAKGMEDMKWDMGGAAAVTGAMAAVAARKVKRNIVGIIGLVENMPDGNAQRPGDVVTSMSGQTIEVINTDAEGRLVLADCLTYCQEQFKPQMIVDLATLTGAIIVALGKDYAGLFANDNKLRDAIVAAGDATADQCWPMPMGDNYDKMLKSHIADMKNIGGPWGGSITAACFLGRFVQDGTPWAHIDMAGKAWADKAGHAHPAGGTGYGVRLLNKLADDWQDA